MVGDYLLQTDWQARHKRCGLGGDPVALRALLDPRDDLHAGVRAGADLDRGRARPRCGRSSPRVLIFLPAPGDRRRARRAALHEPASNASTASRRAWPPRSISRSTCSRCSSWRCWWDRHEPRPPRALALLAVALSRSASGCCSTRPTRSAGVELASRRRCASRCAATQDPPPDVVIVGDGRPDARGAARATIRSNRKRHADVIGELTKAGAGVIAYDVQFTEPSDDPEADDALIEAVSDAPSVVLGTTEVAPRRHDGDLRRRARCSSTAARRRRHAVPATTTTAGSGRCTFEVNRLETFAIAAARLKLGARAACPRAAGLDRLPGPGRHVRPAELRRRRARHVRRRRRPRQGRRRRRDGDARQGLPRDRRRAVGCRARRSRPPRSRPRSPASRCTTRRGGSAPLAILAARRSSPRSWRWRFGAIVGGASRPGRRRRVPGGRAARVQRAARSSLVVPPLAAARSAASAPDAGSAAARVADPTRCSTGSPAARGNQRTRRLRASLLLGRALFVVAAVALVAAGRRTRLRRLELSTVNPRFDVRGTTPAADDVVVVAIDDKTFTSRRSRRDRSRARDHAQVIRHLDEGRREGDRLRRPVQRAERATRRPTSGWSRPSRRRGNVVLATTDRGRARTSQTEIFDVARALAYSGGDAGWTRTYPSDPDGKIRRMPFATRTASSRSRSPRPRLTRGGPIDAAGDSSAGSTSPGPAATVKWLSFVDVAPGKFNAADVRGKVVVVGAHRAVAAGPARTRRPRRTA